MFFKCSHRSVADEGKEGFVVSKNSSKKIVDIHCHRECAPAAEMMEAEANFSPMNMLKGFGFTIVGYTLFGLIVAAITKKNNMNS